MPEVSVVIPAYNAERTLGETLTSVLAQTFTDMEVIVIDDGSTDATAQIAESMGAPSIRVIRTDNGGVARARNRGINEARGELVALLDSDDTWLPTKLERQVGVMRETPRVGLCFTAAIRVDAEGGSIGAMPIRECRNYTEALLLHSMVAGCISSGLVRRQLAMDVGGFDVLFSQSADWDFWLRLSCVTNFSGIAAPLVRYRSWPANMSSNIALLERDTFAVLDKFFAEPASRPYLPLRSRAYSAHWMICAGSYLHNGNIRASMRCLGRGIAAHPPSIRRPLGLPRRCWRRMRLARNDSA